MPEGATHHCLPVVDLLPASRHDFGHDFYYLIIPTVHTIRRLSHVIRSNGHLRRAYVTQWRHFIKFGDRHEHQCGCGPLCHLDGLLFNSVCSGSGFFRSFSIP